MEAHHVKGAAFVIPNPWDAGSTTLVGNLTTSDPDAADSHSYQLVAGVGDHNNALLQHSTAQPHPVY